MTLRLIDANLDRLGEGLRVLEDVARFHLDDGPLSERLKNLRHEMVTVSPALKENLLASRNSESDVGRQRIAAKRAQESLRVLEECAKLPEMPPELQKREFERARFDLYHIEKELSLKLSRKDTQAQIAGLHVIIDVQSMAGRQAIDIARPWPGKSEKSAPQPTFSFSSMTTSTWRWPSMPTASIWARTTFP